MSRGRVPLSERRLRRPHSDRAHLWFCGREIARLRLLGDDTDISRLYELHQHYRPVGRTLWEYSARDSTEVLRRALWSGDLAGRVHREDAVWRSIGTLSEEQCQAYRKGAPGRDVLKEFLDVKWLYKARVQQAPLLTDHGVRLVPAGDAGDAGVPAALPQELLDADRAVQVTLALYRLRVGGQVVAIRELAEACRNDMHVLWPGTGEILKSAALIDCVRADGTAQIGQVVVEIVRSAVSRNSI